MHSLVMVPPRSARIYAALLWTASSNFSRLSFARMRRAPITRLTDRVTADASRHSAYSLPCLVVDLRPAVKKARVVGLPRPSIHSRLSPAVGRTNYRHRVMKSEAYAVSESFDIVAARGQVGRRVRTDLRGCGSCLLPVCGRLPTLVQRRSGLLEAMSPSVASVSAPSSARWKASRPMACRVVWRSLARRLRRCASSLSTYVMIACFPVRLVRCGSARPTAFDGLRMIEIPPWFDRRCRLDYGPSEDTGVSCEYQA